MAEEKSNQGSKISEYEWKSQYIQKQLETDFAYSKKILDDYLKEISGSEEGLPNVEESAEGVWDQVFSLYTGIDSDLTTQTILRMWSMADMRSEAWNSFAEKWGLNTTNADAEMRTLLAYEGLQYQSQDVLNRLNPEILGPSGGELLARLAPGLGLLIDVKETVTGRFAIGPNKDKEMPDLDRAFAVIGTVSLGYGSKVKAGLNELEVIARGASAEEKRVIKDSITAAESYLKSANILNRYGPFQKGPLHMIRSGTSSVADTFRSSSYFKVSYSEPTKLYRVFGGEAKELGPYWSRTKPFGPLQAQIDSAMLPEFKNTKKYWVEIEVPANKVMYEGSASEQYLISQGGEVGSLMGGGNQVFIEYVDPSWRTGVSGAF
jgi:hypothetical protein